MDQCDCCHGLRGHMRLKNAMCEEFDFEHTRAKLECVRLQGLLRDVCWYNFETRCRSWQTPWPTSYENSFVELNGVSIEISTRNGREREIGHFPLWYSGTIRDAPILPPEIIALDLKDAMEYLAFTEQQRTAPHDWAPGGKLYNTLLETTTVPTDLSRKRELAHEAASRISKRILGDGGRS